MRYVPDDDDGMTVRLGDVNGEPTAHTRHGDPETSHEAASTVGDPRFSQQAVLSILKQVGPCTDEQLVAAYMLSRQRRQSPSGIRTRRAELVTQGLVEWTGTSSIMRTGRRGRVWRAVE